MRILRRKHEYTELTHSERKSKSKHRRTVKNTALETVLRDWIIQVTERKKGRLTTALIKEKAQQFARSLNCAEDFKFSNGWYHLFF